MLARLGELRLREWNEFEFQLETTLRLASGRERDQARVVQWLLDQVRGTDLTGARTLVQELQRAPGGESDDEAVKRMDKLDADAFLYSVLYTCTEGIGQVIVREVGGQAGVHRSGLVAWKRLAQHYKREDVGIATVAEILRFVWTADQFPVVWRKFKVLCQGVAEEAVSGVARKTLALNGMRDANRTDLSALFGSRAMTWPEMVEAVDEVL